MYNILFALFILFAIFGCSFSEKESRLNHIREKADSSASDLMGIPKSAYTVGPEVLEPGLMYDTVFNPNGKWIVLNMASHGVFYKKKECWGNLFYKIDLKDSMVIVPGMMSTMDTFNIYSLKRFSEGCEIGSIRTAHDGKDLSLNTILTKVEPHASTSDPIFTIYNEFTGYINNQKIIARYNSIVIQEEFSGSLIYLPDKCPDDIKRLTRFPDITHDMVIRQLQNINRKE